MEWIEAVEEDLRMLDEVRMVLGLKDGCRLSGVCTRCTLGGKLLLQVPLETQLQIVANIEEDLQLWRPDIDQVVAMSSQLQVR